MDVTKIEYKLRYLFLAGTIASLLSIIKAVVTINPYGMIFHLICFVINLHAYTNALANKRR